LRRGFEQRDHPRCRRHPRVRAPWGFCRFPWLICLESPDLNPDESAVSLLASKKDCSIRQATTIRQPPVFLLILEKPPPDPSREETGKYCWKLVLEATSAPVPFARVQSRERDTRQCLPPQATVVPFHNPSLLHQLHKQPAETGHF